MDTFFSDYLYRAISWLYSLDLDDYLAGAEMTDSGAVYGNYHQVSYPMLGGISLGLVIVAAVVYYYAINRSSFNRWYHWGLVGLIAGVVNLVVGFVLCNNALQSGNIEQWIKPIVNQNVVNVDEFNCFMLGLGNLVIAIVLYFVFSMMMKWWSRNCKRTPF